MVDRTRTRQKAGIEIARYNGTDGPSAGNFLGQPVQADAKIAADPAWNSIVGAVSTVSDARAAVALTRHSGTWGARDFDRGRRGDPFRFAEVALPGLNHPWNPQIRHGVAGQAGFGLGADPRRTFIANLTSRAGGGPGKRRDGSRMIVSLYLHQDINRLVIARVPVRQRVREKSRSGTALDDGGVIAIGGQHTAGVARVSGANHCKQ